MTAATDLAGHLRAQAEADIDAGLTRGMQIVVLCDGETIVDLAIGKRAQDDEPVTPDTRFAVFSTSKSFTATAVHLLVERGLLHYGDLVSRFVPEFAQGGKGSATIAHLLLHQGGFPDAAETVAPEAYNDWETAVSQVCALPAEWAPGSSIAYHTVTAYTLLGEVVRRIVGMDFAEFCQREIFDSLDLRQTSWGRPVAVSDATDTIGIDSVRDAIAKQWTGPAARASVMPPIGLHSTARDLARFFETWRLGGGDLLAADTVAEAVRRHIALVGEFGFGYGFFVGNDPRGPQSRGTLATLSSFGHPGMCSSQAYTDPETGIVVAMLANVDPGQQASDTRFGRLCDLVAVGLAEPSNPRSAT